MLRVDLLGSPKVIIYNFVGITLGLEFCVSYSTEQMLKVDLLGSPKVITYNFVGSTPLLTLS